MRLIVATTLLLMTSIAKPVVVAQRVLPTTRFEVTSIRPVESSSAGLIRITPNGQLVGSSTLKNLIVLAYEVDPYERVVGVEPAVSRALEERFEVNALPPESSRLPSQKEIRTMARQMLEERFGLKLRIDSELVSATVLRVIKAGVFGPGLRPAPEGCVRLPPGTNLYDGKSTETLRRNCMVTMFGRTRGTVTLDEFARVISFAARRPILNRTGLEGLFAIDVAFDIRSLAEEVPSRLGARVPGPADQSDAPAFVDALSAQMGLSARTERQSIRLFVVEHVGPLVAN